METSPTETTTETATETTTTANATTNFTQTTKKSRKQPRKRPLPPDVTSRNLAIEKRRRQDMNRLFLDLARCVPSLASTTRLSKNLIVMESLQYLREQRDMCIAAGRELRELLFAHNELIVEVNTLRSQLRIPVNNAPRPPSTAFLSLMDVENKIYGEFPDGFARPNTTYDDGPQASVRQRGNDTSLPGLPIPPTPVRTSAESCLLNYLYETRDVVTPDVWPSQTPGHAFSPSNVQGAFVPDADWWGFNVSEPNPELLWEDLPAHIPPSEEAYDEGSLGYPGGASEACARSSF